MNTLSAKRVDVGREFGNQRGARILALWGRFVARRRSPAEAAADDRCTTLNARLWRMIEAARCGQLQPASAIEAADLAVDHLFDPPAAGGPTTARPGSAQKVAVLAARALAGQPLWHPDDADFGTHADTLLAMDESPD